MLKNRAQKLDQTNIIYINPCNDYQTQREPNCKKEGCRLATQRHDQNSLMFIQEDEYGHTFNWYS